MPPAVGAGVGTRRLARLDAPHLLLAAAIILTIVRDPERRDARLVPVGEQHRKRAKARRERRAHRIVGPVARLRPIERILLARSPRGARRVAVDIMADRQRREFLSRLPLGGERGRPAGIAVEIPFLVGEREGAVGPALEQEISADPQHEQVHVSVAVDVDRIGADDILEELGIPPDVERLLLELERPAGLRHVNEELRRILAAGEEHRGEARTVAIESRAAAADEEFPRTVVDAVNPSRVRLFVHDRHVADRPKRAVGGARAGEGEDERQDKDDGPHHGASMTSERRKATTLSRLSGSSAR